MKTVQAPLSPLSRRFGTALIALACVAGASSAWAQWQWRDASGRRIFSDTPPPASVADKDILQRPKGATPPPAATAADATASAPAAPAKPAAPAADTQLEQRKQQLEKAEADKRKAEEKANEEKAAKVRAANCENARKNKAMIESGVRVTVANSKGEAEYLDEAGRAAQLRQANDIIRENCR
jgi:4-amino-4-deoxy-L-arabinose transferase-like glycosyltransferase